MSALVFKKSIYSTLFNYKTNKFNVDEHLSNYSIWADEVVVATINDNDDTYNFLLGKVKQFPKLIVLKTELKQFTPTFDGDLKNAALQACVGDILLQLDFDEKMSVHNLDYWNKLSEILLESDTFSAVFVPSINLYKDKSSFSSFSQKWYLHKRGLYRGVVSFAKNGDGTHDTNRSDSCELIDSSGNLVPAFLYFDLLSHGSPIEATDFLRDQNLPYVIHYGWIDLNRRVEINQNFWNKQWEAEAGHEVELISDLNQIQSFQKFNHNLIIP
jgi:hypothetical protein